MFFLLCFRSRAATRPAQLSMNEFGMLAAVIAEADGQEEGLEGGSGGASQGHSALAGTAGAGGAGGPGGGQYRYHGAAQEGFRPSAGTCERRTLSIGRLAHYGFGHGMFREQGEGRVFRETLLCVFSFLQEQLIYTLADFVGKAV